MSRRDKLDKLAAYKQARQGGPRVLKEEPTDIYDEVSEEQYRSIVKGRLLRDDFVVDDGGAEGYMDNGQEDWLEAEEDEDEDDRPKSKKAGKAKAKAKAKPKPAPPPKPQPTIDAYRAPISVAKEQDLLSSLFQEFDQKVASTVPSTSNSRKRKPSPPSDAEDILLKSKAKSKYSYRRRSPEPSSDAAPDLDFDDENIDVDESPQKAKRVKVDVDLEAFESLEVKSTASASDGAYDDIDMDAFMDVDDFDVGEGPVKKEEKEPVISFSVPAQMAPAPKNKSWLSYLDTLSVQQSDDALGSTSASSASVSSSNITALEPDGSLRFFWLDYLELDGKLYFIGKLKDKASGIWVSCCVTIENLERNIFVLPRDKRAEQDEDGELVDTDIIPSNDDVWDDFEIIRKACNVKKWRGKFVKRKYAFGLEDVPRGEREWMKVVYPFEDRATIPADACSQNIARVFGTNTTAFELLVLKRKIMGPCWIQIKNPVIESKGISWCKLEATVSDPKDFNPFPDSDVNAPKEIPPLTIASLSLRTIVNHHENKREVVCVSARVWENMNIEDPTPPEKLRATLHTFVRPLVAYPAGFEKEARKPEKGSPVTPCPNERALLNGVLTSLYKADPDIIIGHDFLGSSLDVLLTRMRELKNEHWSRLSRFRRSRWPGIGKQGTNMRFLSGRLLADLGSDGAKSMISSTTWSLSEMCKTHLGIDREEAPDPDELIAALDSSVKGPDGMMEMLRHCEFDTYLQMAICGRVQMLGVTRVLTSLAGNSWNKTLNGGRAERNEYILLHEFHRLKYIVPDKSFGGYKAKEVTDGDDNTKGKAGGKKRRDKYKGGLVFEPKRGLWDTYILVMDFNSLYPSIIQEYNIDFTTVEASGEEEADPTTGEDRIPDPPPAGTPLGVLPRLISTLVNRRRQVKSLMKSASASGTSQDVKAKLLQWDIQQQALKLTANSMYGCLGFEYSRFYAMGLAALTTFKGREILVSTREVAEGMGLDVIYGDTDSVFVNSGQTDFAEALRIADRFKIQVNERYQKLEIDLDSVFQRLLLLQKKKYAAVKVEGGAPGGGAALATKMEIKGLDMKRREYCVLSKNVSEYVLTKVLSGEGAEVVVEGVHDYLRTIGQEVRAGNVELDRFVINKKLGKNPEDYPDAKSQPHVQVALRMKARGSLAKIGDVVPYVFCVPLDLEGKVSVGDRDKMALADKARHPDEIRKGGWAIDYEYYLSHQVLPPIERLCEPIEGTDRARLAECLGLDASRYRSVAGGDEHDGGSGAAPTFMALDSQMSDADRFKDAIPFRVRCKHCQAVGMWGPLWDDSPLLHMTGVLCPACSKSISAASLHYQLEAQIRECIGRYYEGWTVCDDPVCAIRTRMVGVESGRECLKKGCLGRVWFEYTDTQLCNQLRYFGHLFDAKKARSVALTKAEDDKARIEAIVHRNEEKILVPLGAVVEKYMNQCGRRWVDLANIFGGMRLA